MQAYTKEGEGSGVNGGFFLHLYQRSCTASLTLCAADAMAFEEIFLARRSSDVVDDDVPSEGGGEENSEMHFLMQKCGNSMGSFFSTHNVEKGMEKARGVFCIIHSFISSKPYPFFYSTKVQLRNKKAIQRTCLDDEISRL